MDKAIERNLSPEKNHVNSVTEVQKILDDCKQIKSFCDRHKVQLILISSHWFQDFYNYGCSSCEENIPNTLRPKYDRRTWRLLEDEQKVYSTILVIETDKDISLEHDFVKKTESPYFYIIENNKLQTMVLLRSLNMECRKYK